MGSVDWPRLINDCLESTQFMALATIGQGNLWNHAVYFAWDHELKLYFMSRPSSRHMQNIAANGKVAAAVFLTDQSPADDVCGLQFSGVARILPDQEVPDAHANYFKRAPVIEGIPHRLPDFLGPGAEWKLVSITPTEIGYFDTKLFGEHRQTVPKGVQL